MVTLLNTFTRHEHDRRVHYCSLIGLTFITWVYQSILGTDFYGFELRDTGKFAKKWSQGIGYFLGSSWDAV